MFEAPSSFRPPNIMLAISGRGTTPHLLWQSYHNKIK
jgi:hypothetical protein